MTLFLIALAINNVSQNSCFFKNDGRSANFSSINSPFQNGIDYPEKCKNGQNRENGNYENDSDDGFDDNSDSCCTSDVTDNAFDGVDNSGTQTAKYCN